MSFQQLQQYPGRHHQQASFTVDPRAGFNRVPSFTAQPPQHVVQPPQHGHSLQQASLSFQHNLARQNSWEKLNVERQNSWDVQRQRSFERLRGIQHASASARQHSYTFRAGPGVSPMQANGWDDSPLVGGSLVNGSELYGSELMNGSELYGGHNATQVAGVLSSLHGGSIFLKSTYDGDITAKNRASLIPRHKSSNFTRQNYTVVKELGRGSFSRVQLLRDKRSGVARVLKISEGGVGTKESQMLKNEIHLLSALDHPSICKIFEYSEDISQGQLLMVLEYVAGGDCQQLLRSSPKPQSEAFVAKLIWQLLGVLTYCHARGVLHCDIKPENMMLTQTPGGGLPDCKVIDFGLAHRIDRPSRDFVGTPSYMAPEIVKGTAAYTVKADIWSVGVTACELLANRAPFGKPQEYNGKYEAVLENIRNFTCFEDVEARLDQSENWATRSTKAKNFVRSLIIMDPADRPHADQALDDTWLQKNKAWPSSLSSFMLKSMVRFMGASSLMRRCLLIIAARVGSPKMEQIGNLFISIDDEYAGHITREGLAAVVSSAATCWEPEFDVDDFFDAADQDQTDVVSFLEFAATCLWGKDDSTNTIAERVFKALDDNHDGMVHFSECRHLFRECDISEIQNLPMHRPFGIQEWLKAVGGSNDLPMKKEMKQPEGSILAQFIRSFMCSETDPGVEDSAEATW